MSIWCNITGSQNNKCMFTFLLFALLFLNYLLSKPAKRTCQIVMPIWNAMLRHQNITPLWSAHSKRPVEMLEWNTTLVRPFKTPCWDARKKRHFGPPIQNTMLRRQNEMPLWSAHLSRQRNPRSEFPDRTWPISSSPPLPPAPAPCNREEGEGVGSANPVCYYCLFFSVCVDYDTSHRTQDRILKQTSFRRRQHIL